MISKYFTILVITLLCWCCTLVQLFPSRCNKNLDYLNTEPVNPTNKFYLEIYGSPEGYITREKYSIRLLSESQPFTDFLLMVENENGEEIFSNSARSTFGRLDLEDDVLSKFSDVCPNAVIQTNQLPKMEASVTWTAPEFQSGCVHFKAVVAESSRVWYEGESLTKILCEATDDGESLPAVLEECCACPEAKYEITFEGLWSRNTHPKDFPEDNWSTKFSDIIGASHSVNYSFWNFGESATEGLKQLTENGNSRELERELKDHSRHIRTIIKARGISYPNITGKTFAVFRVDKIHHLVSLVSVIFPSPDWFVGFSNLELCLSNCSWIESKILNLYPIDAGINNGITYMDRDISTLPPDKIRQIKSDWPHFNESPLFDESGEPMKPFARIYLSRQRLYQKDCKIESPKSKCLYGTWSEWDPCLVTCGRGTQHRQRSLLSNNPQECGTHLTERRSCPDLVPCRLPPSTENFQQLNNPSCETTDWGEWSTCSSSCGAGTKTRSRRYKHRSAAKRCAAIFGFSRNVEQNLECMGKNCTSDSIIYDECPQIKWSEWSVCLSLCGPGNKIRSRRIDATDRRRTFENCDNIKKIEIVNCVNDDRPTCSDEGTSSIETKQHIRLGARIKNDYSFLQNDAPINALPTDDTTTPSEVTSSSEPAIPSEPPVTEADLDCEVGDWSDYSECDAECGTAGFMRRLRKVIQYKQGNGKDCEELLQVKNCFTPCLEGEDTVGNMILKKRKRDRRNKFCKMTNWSPWSPCTQSCGTSGVQQRTREIVRRKVKKGEFCSLTTQMRSCNLMPCNDNNNSSKDNDDVYYIPK